MQYFVNDEPKTWELLSGYYSDTTGAVPEWVLQRQTLLDMDSLHDVACMCSRYELPIGNRIAAVEAPDPKPITYRLRGQMAYEIILDYHTEHSLMMSSRFANGGGRTIIDNPELMRAVAEAASYYELDLGCLLTEVMPNDSTF